MLPYSKHFGLWLLLSAGVCALASNIAAFFGYTGTYNLELVTGCITISLVVAAFTYQRARRKYAASPWRPNSDLINAFSDLERTKAQRLRWFFTGMGSIIVFLILDFVAYQSTQHLFPNMASQMILAVALAISVSLAVLFGMFFYYRMRPGTIPER